MPRTCTVCSHAERQNIDRALIAGESFRGIARTFRVSDDAVSRHRAEHLPEKLVRAEQAAQVAEATDLLREVRILRSKAYSLLLSAERAGDYRTALAGVREARGCLELLAELEGELERRPTVNIILLPEWQTLVSTLRRLLAPYPALLADVSRELLALEGRDAAAH